MRVHVLKHLRYEGTTTLEDLHLMGTFHTSVCTNGIAATTKQVGMFEYIGMVLPLRQPVFRHCLHIPV